MAQIEHHTGHSAPLQSLIRSYSIHLFLQVVSHDITTAPTVYSVDDQMFVPGTEYAARVRSSPNLVFYKGQWSDWSSEVHWKIESAMTGENLKKYTAYLSFTEPLKSSMVIFFYLVLTT